jgi:site-specific DNA-methyltransferase (adenine-specific)
MAAPHTAWRSNDGESVLWRGDSLALLRTVPDESVDCVWTDPPYLLSNGGTTCVAGRRARVNKGAWDRSQGVDADHAFNLDWLAQCRRVLRPAGTIWVSGTLHVYLSVGMALQQLGFRLLNDVVWEKPNPPPNLGCRCFTHSTEIVLWASRSPRGAKARYTFHYDAMRAENGGKQMKNVWRFSAPARAERAAGRHPTQKPVALVSRCLRASTHPGDVVLDPFAGSGTTGVAALSLGRRFLGIEREPDYAALAVRRLRAAAPSPDASSGWTLSATPRAPARRAPAARPSPVAARALVTSG